MGLFVVGVAFDEAAKQVHVLADVVFATVGSLRPAQEEVDAILHGLPLVGAVPAVFGWVCPLIEFLAPAVEDVGVELYEALVVLGLERFVVFVAIGREGIGEAELALADGDAKGDGVELHLTVVELHLERDQRGAGRVERVVGVLFIAHHEVLLFVFHAEMPLVGGDVVAHAGGIGIEVDEQRRLACNQHVFLGGLGWVALFIRVSGGGRHFGCFALCGGGHRHQQGDKGGDDQSYSHFSHFNVQRYNNNRRFHRKESFFCFFSQ